MSLWAWAVAVYSRPGVEAACLELQDRYGQNVVLLLWAAWARPRDEALIMQAVELARTWDQVALAPLRVVRRGLKRSLPPVGDPGREQLREAVKAVELQAERTLLETLEQMSSATNRTGAPLAAVTNVSRAWGQAISDDVLAAFVTSLA